MLCSTIYDDTFLLGTFAHDNLKNYKALIMLTRGDFCAWSGSAGPFFRSHYDLLV